MIDNIVHFFNSNFLQSLITLLVGFVALFVYLKQKKDEKRAAANSILLEIQHIESNISKIKEAARKQKLSDLTVSVLREDAWSKYSHLFSNDFDKDEWEIITNFYQNARLLNDVIQDSIQSFAQNVNQIRINRQRVIADLNKDFLDELKTADNYEKALENHNNRLDVFTQLYMQRQDEMAYSPVKLQNDAERYIEDLPTISVTSIGTKFKQIVK